jgi:hypothetical protein
MNEGREIKDKHHFIRNLDNLDPTTACSVNYRLSFGSFDER